MKQRNKDWKGHKKYNPEARKQEKTNKKNAKNSKQKKVIERYKKATLTTKLEIRTRVKANILNMFLKASRFYPLREMI